MLGKLPSRFRRQRRAMCKCDQAGCGDDRKQWGHERKLTRKATLGKSQMGSQHATISLGFSQPAFPEVVLLARGSPLSAVLSSGGARVQTHPPGFCQDRRTPAIETTQRSHARYSRESSGSGKLATSATHSALNLHGTDPLQVLKLG